MGPSAPHNNFALLGSEYDVALHQLNLTSATALQLIQGSIEAHYKSAVGVAGEEALEQFRQLMTLALSTDPNKKADIETARTAVVQILNEVANHLNEGRLQKDQTPLIDFRQIFALLVKIHNPLPHGHRPSDDATTDRGGELFGMGCAILIIIGFFVMSLEIIKPTLERMGQ